MFPGTTKDNVTDSGFTQTARSRYRGYFSRGIFCPDLKHLLFCQFCHRTSGSSHRPPSQAGFGGVLLISTRRKMIWIAAWWIIATMKNINLGPFSGGQKMRDAMSPDSSLYVVIHHYEKSSVPAIGTAGGPMPTFAFWALPWCFIYIFPKALNIVVGKFGAGYISSRHDLVSFMRKIVSRPVADVQALARVVIYYTTGDRRCYAT